TKDSGGVSYLETASQLKPSTEIYTQYKSTAAVLTAKIAATTSGADEPILPTNGRNIFETSVLSRKSAKQLTIGFGVLHLKCVTLTRWWRQVHMQVMNR
ncbi:hypothetical protein WDW86_13520, partial [Bdellovibrionota bacterium FG-2]